MKKNADSLAGLALNLGRFQVEFDVYLVQLASDSSVYSTCANDFGKLERCTFAEILFNCVYLLAVRAKRGPLANKLPYV